MRNLIEKFPDWILSVLHDTAGNFVSMK